MKLYCNINWVNDILPAVLPADWVCERRGQDGAVFENKRQRLSVVVSGDVEQDGKRWLHLSVAHSDRLPKYETLVEVKELFIGGERKAIQVFPPRSQHVNIHNYCIHLWHCADEDGLPDFARGGKTI